MKRRVVTLVENEWRSWGEALDGTGVDLDDARNAVERSRDAIRRKLKLRTDPFTFRASGRKIEVRASGIAGSVVVGGVGFEVVPKFMPVGNDLQSWSLTAVTLAHYVHGRHSALLPVKGRQWARHRLVDLLGMAFADAVERGLEDQVIHTYRVNEETSPVLRGRLNLSRQLRGCFHRPHLLECDVDQLDAENPFNDVLKWAATVLSRSTYQTSLRARLIRLSEILPGNADKSASRRHVHLRPPPQFRVWSEALELARFLATGYALPVGGGVNDGYSLIFNMERVFERFIEVLLRRSLRQFAEGAFSTESQVWSPYATPSDPQGRQLYCRPDNVVTRQASPVLLVDAKYKMLEEIVGLGDLKQRTPQGPDVYELIVGMVARKCSAGLLVYPKIASPSGGEGRLRSWYVDVFGKRLHVATLPVDLLSLNAPSAFSRIETRLANAVVELSSTVTDAK
jgi:5-methylcytosine-specific restriction enzyme subunit McrC